MIDNKQNNAFIRYKQRQLEVQTCFCEKLNIDKVCMTSNIVLSRQTSLAFDKTINKYKGSLYKNLINFVSFFQCLNFVDNYEDGTKLDFLLVIPLFFDLVSNSTWALECASKYLYFLCNLSNLSVAFFFACIGKVCAA